MHKIYFLLLVISLFSFKTPSSLGADSTKLPAKEPTAPSLTLKVKDYTEAVSAEKYTAWLKYDLTIVSNTAYQSEFENPHFCPAQSGVICELLFDRQTRGHFQGKTTPVFNEQVAKSFLTELAQRANVEPQDAKLKLENGSLATFTPEKEGVQLNEEKSLLLLADFIKKNPDWKKEQALEMAYETIAPKVTAEEINNLGIKTLIGQGTSNFKGSPVNRIKNIKVAANRFNGVLIKPGEEFSFVKNLGEVDAETGYFPELVIKKGVTEPEFGGGVCQVSTTAFRAAIYAGLEITARRNHAYPVSYYNPQGMDSTVYVPQPDLRFKNNTPGHILMQTRIVGTELFFDFYGTDDGRKTTVDGPTITERQPDGALKTTFTQHVVDKDGKEFITEVFNSSYASPYKYPHLGGPTLSVKPSNWSEEEWKAYKNTLKDLAKAAAEAAKNPSKR